jgi:ClpP class serine protease
MAMGFSDVLWIFLMVTALQPILRQKFLEARRLRLLAQLEKKRGSRVIALVHRQETMSLLGFPLMRYIDIHDSEEVLRAVKLTDTNCPIDLIVHTPGGLVLAAGQIANALRRHRARVTVFVPHSSVLTVLERKAAMDIDDRTLILADVARKALAQMKTTVHDLLAERMPQEQASALADKLSRGAWTHDYPITAEEAKSLGLPISTEVPEEIFEFMSFFPQPTRAPLRGVHPDPLSRPAGASGQRLKL